MIKTFEIWMEGYAVTGNSSDASFIGKADGETFEEACKNFRYPEDIIRPYDGYIMVKKGSPLALDNTYDYPSIWACRLYDNEADARKSFG